MKRMLASAAAAASVLLFCAIAVVWLDSTMDPRLSVRRTFDGIAVVPEGGFLDQKSGEPSLLESNLVVARKFSRTGFACLGFEYRAGGTPNAPIGAVPEFWFVTIPYWSLLLLTGVGPAWWLYRRRRREHRMRHGLCRNCGYDLRGTGDRCPECGHVPAAPAAT
jgi:hypothetical protein